MANPQITTTPVSTAFSTTNTSTATASATNWSTQSFTGPSVSSTNAESIGMNTTNIVQSNLTGKVPYSISSINFDGSQDYIDTNSTFTLTSFSVSTWFKRDTSASGGQFIISSRTGSGGSSRGIAIEVNGSLIQCDVYNSAITRVYAGSIVSDVWYNVVMTYDGTTLKGYLNGSPFSGLSSKAGSYLPSATNMAIGKYTYTSAFFNGMISNVSIFDQVITQDDVVNLYNNGTTQDLNNFRVTPTSWYPLDQSYTYFNGSVLIPRDVISGNDGTGVNLIQSNIIGNAPSSENAGKGFAMASGFFLGKSKDSVNNSYSINMADYADGVTNPANSGRSTDIPS